MRDILLAVFKTGSGSVATLLLGMITTKVVAINLGPSGIGLFSLLRQTRDTFRSLASLNGTTALVQGSASRKGLAREQYLLTVLLILFLSALLTASVLLFFAPQIARAILHQDDQHGVSLARWLVLPVLLGTLMVYLGGILNGYRAIGRLALTQVVSAATAVLLAYPATYWVKQGYPVAFVGMMTASSAVGAGLAFGFTRQEGWFPSVRQARNKLQGSVASEAGYHFFSFALTTLITGSASTWAILAVRAMVVSHGDMSAAGVFDVAWTLSMMYTTLVLSSFGTYYLPTLSQCDDVNARVDLIHHILRLTTFLVVPLIIAIIVLKPLVVRLLYSEQFLPALRIIRWMLIGDYLKATSWTFGVTIKAFADKKALFWSEILWYTGFAGFSVLALFKFKSLEGVGVAFAFVYLVYLAYTYYYVRKHHHFLPTRRLMFKWTVGLLLLCGASVHTWSSIQVNWSVASLWLLVALAYSGFSLSAMEREQVIHFVRKRTSLLFGRHNVS